MKYEQGTEETSLGANETDSLDARGDCKHTMDATSQTEVVCQAWRGKEIKPSRHEALPVHYKGDKAKFKK